MPESTSVHFTPRQLKTLEAAVNRIIPEDDYPSGWQAGVGNYLERQFHGDLSGELDNYQIALDCIDAMAKQLGDGFAESSPATQDSILQLVEANAVQPRWPIDAGGFFRRFVNHCMEGFYADPGNGGNTDAISWKMIGYEVTA